MTEEQAREVFGGMSDTALDIMADFLELTLEVRKPDTPKAAIELYDGFYKALHEGKVNVWGEVKEWVELIRGAISKGECA